MMPIAATYVTTDPAWPWSLPGIGVTALVGIALGLAALTVLTYLGVAKATPGRVASVIMLRLWALSVELLLLLRPRSVGCVGDTYVGSQRNGLSRSPIR